MEERPEIVVIGAAIIDVLVRPATKEIFERGSLPMEAIRMSVGGDAANEAAVLSYLGKKVQLETVIGRDRAGAFLQSYFEEKGVLVPDYALREDVNTGINIVLVDDRGERHFLTDPRGSLRALELKDVRLPYPDSAKIVCFASVFVFPKIRTEELKILFSQAKSQGMILCADLTKRKNEETLEDMAEAFALLDYLFPNEEEAMLLTGEETAEAAAEALFQAGVKNVVLKCGKRGCYIRNAEEKGYIPPEELLVPVDTTGAGDSFAAGFIAGLSEGRSIRECACLANACGAKACRVVGATEWTNG